MWWLGIRIAVAIPPTLIIVQLCLLSSLHVNKGKKWVWRANNIYYNNNSFFMAQNLLVLYALKHKQLTVYFLKYIVWGIIPWIYRYEVHLHSWQKNFPVMVWIVLHLHVHVFTFDNHIHHHPKYLFGIMIMIMNMNKHFYVLFLEVVDIRIRITFILFILFSLSFKHLY